MFKNRFKNEGNSLIEYLLPLVIFTVGGIALALGTGFNTNLAQMMADTSNGQIIGEHLELDPLASQVDKSTLPDGYFYSDPNPNGISTQMVCLSGNFCIETPVFTQEKISETAGGLGGEQTKAMALVLERLAQQLQDEGADSKLVELITNLANNGHGIGNELTNIESGSSTSTSTSGETLVSFGGFSMQMRQSTITNPDGTTLFTAEAYSPLGWLGVAKDDFSSSYTALLDYNTSTGVLNNMPEVKALIDFEATQIQSVSTYEYSTEGPSCGNLCERTTLVNNAPLVHQSSDNICKTGSNKTCLSKP